jgi:hypothetical protein
VSARNQVLARARTLRTAAAVLAAKMATRSSTNLSRIVFLGIAALALMLPKSFERDQVPDLGSTPTIEIIRTRPVAAPVMPSTPGSVQSPPAKTSEGDAKPAPPPPQSAKPAKPLPPSAQPTPPWTDSEIAAARAECDRLLAKVTLVVEPVPPTREGACGAPAAREVKSLGESKVEFEPHAMLSCPMVAALNTWVTEKLQPSAQKSFSSPVVRIFAESYSCRNRYGLANAPISEHAFMNAIDVSAFVLANGKVIKVARAWGPTAHEIEEAEKAAAAPNCKGKIKVAAISKLGAHDLAKESEKGSEAKTKTPLNTAAEKQAAEKQAASAFLHQAHDNACSIFDTVLGPDTNDAHHDHFHLDMKARKGPSLCE